jgi:hypothetical protein
MIGDNISRISSPQPANRTQEAQRSTTGGASASTGTGIAQPPHSQPFDPTLASLRRPQVQSSTNAPVSRPPRGVIRRSSQSGQVVSDAEVRAQSGPHHRTLSKLDLPIGDVLTSGVMENLFGAAGASSSTLLDGGNIKASYEENYKIVRVNFGGRYGPVNVQLDEGGQSVKSIGGYPAPSKEDLQYLVKSDVLQQSLLDRTGDSLVSETEASHSSELFESAESSIFDFSEFGQVHTQSTGPAHSSSIIPDAVREISASPSSNGIEQALMARARANDPEVCEVPMCGTRTVEVPPGQQRQIYTYGLGTCTAVAVVSKHPDGKRIATLSHYPSISTDFQVRALQVELARHAPAGSGVSHEVFVVAPGGYEKDSDGGWQLKAKEHDVVGKLLRTFQSQLPEIKPTLIAFSERPHGGESNAFVIDIPAKVDDPIRYDGLHRGQCEL